VIQWGEGEKNEERTEIWKKGAREEGKKRAKQPAPNLQLLLFAGMKGHDKRGGGEGKKREKNLIRGGGLAL